MFVHFPKCGMQINIIYTNLVKNVKQKNSSLLLLFFVLFIFSTSSNAFARQPTSAELEAIQKETMAVFQNFIKLWQEERYFELYKYGKRKSTNQITIEDFATRMVELDWVPVGFVEGKNPEILYHYRTLLYVNAVIVFRHKSNLNLQFAKKQSFLMLKENGKWCFDLLQMIRSPFYSPPQ